MLLLGRRRRVLRTLIRKAPDNQEGQNKSHLRRFKSKLLTGRPKKGFRLYSQPLKQRHVQLAPDRQKGSDKIHETTCCLCLASCFCWVGGVERYELSYVRHLTIREVKKKPPPQIEVQASNRTTQKRFPFVLSTPEAKTCSTCT